MPVASLELASFQASRKAQDLLDGKWWALIGFPLVTTTVRRWTLTILFLSILLNPIGPTGLMRLTDLSQLVWSTPRNWLLRPGSAPLTKPFILKVSEPWQVLLNNLIRFLFNGISRWHEAHVKNCINSNGDCFQLKNFADGSYQKGKNQKGVGRIFETLYNSCLEQINLLELFD